MDEYELNGRPMNRGNSFFGQDPQAKLLEALHNNEFRTFCRLLKSSDVDLEHYYRYPENKTCLDIACSDPKLNQFVRVLIENEADVNKVNKIHKMAPIHFAVVKGDIKILTELLKAKNLNINLLSNQNTALNLAIKQINKIRDNREGNIKKMEEIIELLLKKGIDSNIPDMKNNTPIHSAANQGLESIVRIILEYSKNDVDLDTFKDEEDESARDVLERCFPHLLLDMSKENKAGQIDVIILCSHLSSGDEEKFLKDFSKIKNAEDKKRILEENNGLYTLLQFACDKGMDGVVHKLLDSGANPNLTAPGCNLTPAVLACIGGYHKILKLLDSNEQTSFEAAIGDSLLQIVIKESKNAIADENVDYQECRRILLTSRKCKPDINFTDVKGNTALHYATKGGDQEVVMELLRNGAYIGTWNKFGEPPLVDMSANTLESYLDECVTTNSEQPFDDDYEIKFKYDFLVPPNTATKKHTTETPLMQTNSDINNILTPETDILLYMIKHPELKYLLNHPVITSFLFLKWQRISCLFYTNITFYTTFWLSLLFYIMVGYDNLEERSDTVKTIVSITKYLTIIGMIVLVLRELFQAIVSPKRYLTHIENWLEIALIVITFNIILNDYIGQHPRQQLCAIAILLSSAEFILLIGCFPPFSTNIEMLKTVSWNFFKFLLWYCILIIAFALSFYTLFHTVKKDENDSESKPFNPNKPENDEDEETDFFVDPGMSLFKTIVMLTGELDAGSIEFGLFPITSHIIFIVFVFVIPIVLFNLLNGLAVSDTQAIRADAELVGHISRVKLISYFESIFLGDLNVYKKTVTKMQNACCCLPGHTWITPRLICIRPLAKRICLFPHLLPTAQIGVKVNQSSIVRIVTKEHRVDDKDPEAACCLMSCYDLNMDTKVIKAAKNLINDRRGEGVNLKKIQFKLNQMEKRFENIENKINLIYDHFKGAFPNPAQLS